ncbi:MAG: NERD domain-containing protein [Burkholderiales bacterium]|nr:NERD domain-containing protein [Burkholderiales bacterium]
MSMLIKSADSKAKDLEILQGLLAHPAADARAKRAIEQEIRTIRSGEKGERDAAYEINFHFGSSKNWAILHDLRIEHDGRVAQIDHILMNRLMEVWVCESKRFHRGVSINEHGEWIRYFNGKPQGMSSPIEQNRKHCALLKAIFDEGVVEPPKRLGFYLFPEVRSMVLVSSNAQIRRPKSEIRGMDDIVKVDQLKRRIDKSESDLLAVARIVNSDTLEDLAKRLAALHSPIAFDWHARFGLKPAAKASFPRETEPHQKAETASTQNPDKQRSSKLMCAACNARVNYNVAKFCWVNKVRFGGAVYCIDCQKGFPVQA